MNFKSRWNQRGKEEEVDIEVIKATVADQPVCSRGGFGSSHPMPSNQKFLSIRYRVKTQDGFTSEGEYISVYEPSLTLTPMESAKKELSKNHPHFARKEE